MGMISIKSKKAFTLIEMLLVLGVLFLFLLAAFVVYPKVRHQVVVNEELTLMRSIVEEVRGKAVVGDYTHVSNKYLTYLKSASATNGMYSSANNAVATRWARPMYAAAWSENNDNVNPRKTRFRIIMQLIPQEYCSDLALGYAEFAETIYINPLGDNSSMEAANILKAGDIENAQKLCSKGVEQYNFTMFFR